MTTREEMIQTVRDAVRNFGAFATSELDGIAKVAVDALHPRQRNSVPLPDGGRMEWHGEKAEPWVRILSDNKSYNCLDLSSYQLPDDLHAECYKLRGRGWLEAASEYNQSHIDYAIHLQRIIEALCHGYDIPAACEKGAPHHFNMATRFKASTPAPTNATPLGYANVYENGDVTLYDTKMLAVVGGTRAVRVAIPLFDHAQTEAELIAALEGCGYTFQSFKGTHDALTLTKRAGGGK